MLQEQTYRRCGSSRWERCEENDSIALSAHWLDARTGLPVQPTGAAADHGEPLQHLLPGSTAANLQLGPETGDGHVDVEEELVSGNTCTVRRCELVVAQLS